MESNLEAQSLGIAMGWKVGNYPSLGASGRILEVPVFDRNTGLWYTLDNEWRRSVRDIR
jgi:hypothetical protein